MEEKESQSQVGTLGEYGTGGRIVKRRAWFSNSVSKKGTNVLAWAIKMPNNRCPFASEVCSKNCYAMTGQFTFHDERYAENYEFTFDPGFVETMASEIIHFAENHSDEQVSVALHEKGEFDSVEYLGKWEEVMTATKDLTNANFFIYTRSWVSHPYRKALEELARTHSYVRVNLSTDSDMATKFGVPKPIGNGLITYLAETDEDIPPPGVDLVFRNLRVRHDTPMERLGDALICPYESKLYIARNKNGAPALEKGKCKPIRCMECRLCIDRSLEEWEKVKGDYAGTPGQEPVSKPATIPALQSECQVGAEDQPPALQSDIAASAQTAVEKEIQLQNKIDHAVTHFQSRVVESCLDAADNRVAIAPYTRDRLTNTAILIYQFANNILLPRGEP